MRANLTNRIRFAGLTAHDDVDYSEAMLAVYGEGKEVKDVPSTSLYSAIEQLDYVELASLYVQNPYDEDQLIPLASANATINPDLAVEYARQARNPDADVDTDGSGNEVIGGFQFGTDGGQFTPGEEEGESMTFGVHSSEYAAVPHIEFFEPLVEALREAELTNIGGEFRVYDHGAQVHGEIVFLDAERQLDRDDLGALFTGLQVGNSYDGSCSMYAMGYAMDGYCRNTMRNITEKRSRKHVGEPDEVAAWWERILIEIGGLADHLGDAIEAALEVELDFLNQPYDVDEFFELLGFPSYLARAAAMDARNRSPREGGTRTVINFWTLYSGSTAALTHDFRGSSEIGSLEDYHLVAKDLLWNPVTTMERVRRAFERREAEEDGDGISLTGQNGIAMIEQFERTLEDRKAEFEAREESVAALLAEVESEE